MEQGTKILDGDELMSKYTDEELKFIGRRNAENWLVQNARWITKLREGTQSGELIRGKTHTQSLRKRLNAGVNYGVLKVTGTYSGCWWKLTPYAEALLRGMEE